MSQSTRLAGTKGAVMQEQKFAMTTNTDHFFFNTFRAYARDRMGELLGPGASCPAQLIHMSRYDARLRLADAAGRFAPGSILELHVPNTASGEGVRAAASVHWVQEDELGLLFDTPLDVGAHELQTMLD